MTSGASVTLASTSSARRSAAGLRVYSSKSKFHCRSCVKSITTCLHYFNAYFRGDSQYLFQGRGTPEAAYALSADYAARHDALGLFETLEEDGAFGALTFPVDGRIVSRDLLDSVLEIASCE